MNKHSISKARTRAREKAAPAADAQAANWARRAREKAAHRGDILAAAERVFAAKGFERATMEEVARAAAFSVGALYNFFENKEVLWAEVITKIGRDFLAAFRAAVAAAPTPRHAIEALIALKLTYAREHGAFLRVFLATHMSDGQGAPKTVIPARCHGLYDTYIDEAAALFKAAMARGQLRRADPVYTVLALEGMVHAYKAYWGRRNLTLSLPAQVRLVRRHFLAPLTLAQGEPG